MYSLRFLAFGGVHFFLDNSGVSLGREYGGHFPHHHRCRRRRRRRTRPCSCCITAFSASACLRCGVVHSRGLESSSLPRSLPFCADVLSYRKILFVCIVEKLMKTKSSWFCVLYSCALFFVILMYCDGGAEKEKRKTIQSPPQELQWFILRHRHESQLRGALVIVREIAGCDSLLCRRPPAKLQHTTYQLDVRFWAGRDICVDGEKKMWWKH